MRLTNTLLVGLTLLVVLGCGMMSGNKEEDSKTEPMATEESPKKKVGDTVVAKWSQNSFYEGKIESIDGSRITVAWEDGSSPSKVDEVDVYPLPKTGAKPEVEIGDIVLAKTGTTSYWNGAEIVGIDGDSYEVKTVENNDISNVSGEKIITVTDAVAANLKQKAGTTEFLKAAQSKKPAAPTGFEPKKGELVLAEWTTNSWWAGKVQKSSGSKMTIAWEDGSKPTEVDSSKVVPFPSSKDDKMPEVDQYLLVKPVSGTKWEYAQATSKSGSDIEVKTAAGKTRTVKPGEFVLLN